MGRLRRADSLYGQVGHQAGTAAIAGLQPAGFHCPKMQNRLSPAGNPCCQRPSILRDVGVAFPRCLGRSEMIVCSCNVFSDHQVRSVIAKDARRPRMSEVYSGLGCSAQCGRCAHTIKKIMDDTPGYVHANASMH